MALLWGSAMAQQETAGYWLSKGSESLEQALNETQNETSRDLLLQEALDAYNKTVEIDPQSVWACRKRAESCLS